ncbi:MULTISPECIES: phosphate-starvation-inducible PsiE family protein [Planktothricoides]|uniref:Phosphate-starvation-inducible PsiE family protein n=2 Tax=Planktothricoides raciborskii TaxID=132608 RepID=A0AAU8JIS7_9CYAN|nr:MULTISPECIES: phosphate-starvation-inducible PsiE family protein [Planktothricoides]KOR37028.1 hypothetical protein AM228_09580 [Planktothricoides sp. SR001]MBD2545251.1 phosphate-starvation-inducible PsiE family protein [Planktothricoides raciborskii FACHB-1370]MBD2584431.1 phosphate-starvation-inducible PsiE family protein [Planktothricoides raciborskii FACHB-1261]
MKNERHPQINLIQKIISFFDDSVFIYSINKIQKFTAKVLSLVMIFVIIVSVWDLIIVTLEEFTTQPVLVGHQILFKLFGLFLDVLIALEILENITAYLQNNVVQMELVLVTSLIAMARKIIIFDFNKAGGFDLIGVATAILALSLSYFIIRHSNRRL